MAAGVFVVSAASPPSSSPGARAGEGAIWVGEEAGLLIAAVLVIAAVVVCRRPWRVLLCPGAPMVQAAVVSR